MLREKLLYIYISCVKIERERHTDREIDREKKERVEYLIIIKEALETDFKSVTLG